MAGIRQAMYVQRNNEARARVCVGGLVGVKALASLYTCNLTYIVCQTRGLLSAASLA